MLLVMVDGVLVMVPPASFPNKLILEHTVIMGCFNHLNAIAQNPLWCNLASGIIHLLLLVVINPVLMMVMLELVFVLASPTSPTRRLHHLWVAIYKSVLIMVLRRGKI